MFQSDANMINALRITHLPTGEQATVTSRGWRGVSSHKARQQALALLRSRLWARQNGVQRSDEVVASYELPDDDPFPNELSDYRR